MASSILPDICYDAVVVIPGIMGSVLKDAATGEQLWGALPAMQMAGFWGSDERAYKLMLTAEEREGHYGRVRASSILRVSPAAVPVLQGIEPYDGLVKGVRDVLADPSALLEFPYDWRLPVEYNASVLANRAWEHLKAWRAHPKSPDEPGAEMPKLVIVAHSMGGLVARALGLVEGRDGVPELTPEIRSIITLGTPFRGAAKAVMLLAAGEGTPVKFAKQRMRRLSRTLPGVYDLLPVYACVQDGLDVRRFNPGDATAVEADPELTKQSVSFHDRLKSIALPSHQVLVGTAQDTIQGVRRLPGAFEPLVDEFVWVDGVVQRHAATDEPKLRKSTGDGTVARHSAGSLGLGLPLPLPQQHLQLAKSVEGLNFVQQMLLQRPRGEPLSGAGEIGVVVPDIVEPGTVVDVTVTGTSTPSSVAVRVFDLTTNSETPRPSLLADADHLIASVRLPNQGLYRFVVQGGPGSAVTQIVLCVSDHA